MREAAFVKQNKEKWIAFEKALQAYFSKEFKKAEEYLTIVCEKDPYDKAARLFLSRAKENQKIDLPEYWDGVEKIEYK